MNLTAWRTTSPLLAELDDETFAFLSSLATERTLAKDEVIFRVDTPANRFFMVTSGTIAVRTAGSATPPVTIQTFGEGALLGISWRLPPHRWQWTAQANQDSTVAEFDANVVLSKCEQDPTLDAAMWKVIARESSKRLQNVRMQLLDLYGSGQP
ncbi:MAG: Crp/Fnr family transcriptional regulator [Acidimicrobiia bacterium]